MSDAIKLRPIGVVHTPWRTLEECPRNGRQPDPIPECRVRVLPGFVEGLKDIEGFSHLILVYWLDRAKTPRMLFKPPFDDAEHGVFTTRAPHRPNPIGLSVVAFDGMDGADVLKVRYLDCVDGTALLDIKPYLPSTDAEPEATMGWLAPHRTGTPRR